MAQQNNSKKTFVASAAAGILAVSGMTASTALAEHHGHDHGGSGDKVPCYGVNKCKGTGACGGKGHSCAGENACKGQGYLNIDKETCLKIQGGRLTAEEAK